MYTFHLRAFILLLTLSSFYHYSEPVVSDPVVTTRGSDSMVLSWTIDDVNSSDAVTVTPSGGSAVTISAPKNTGTVTGLASCTTTTFTINEASSPASTVTIDATTRPPKPTISSAVASATGMVTVTITAVSPVASTSCPYWIEVWLTLSGETTPAYALTLPSTATSAVFYDVNPGTYSVVAYTVLPADVSDPSTAVSVTVADYTTTTSTTGTTTTAEGGQFIATIKGKAYNRVAGSAATYRTAHGKVGSESFNTAETALCVSLNDIVAGNTTLSSAMESCYAIKFTNGSLIAEMGLAFTYSKLKDTPETDLKTHITALVASESQTGDLVFKPSVSAVTVAITKNAGKIAASVSFVTMGIAYLFAFGLKF